MDVNDLIMRVQLSVLSSQYSVYSGHHSLLIPPAEVELSPALWLTVVSQYKSWYFLTV
jgi:hypothetical protein